MLKTIIQKELKRVFSDKRMIFSTFILPAISIFLIYNLMGVLTANRFKELETHLPRVVAVSAPKEFVDFYENGVNKLEYQIRFEDSLKDETREEIREGSVDAALVFPAHFMEDIAQYQSKDTPDVHLYYNPTEDYSNVAKNLVRDDLLQEFQNMILKERFGSLDNITAFSINAEEKRSGDAEMFQIKHEKKASGFGVAQFLPMILSIMLFASAMGIGMETIAGEKERGTMGALLLTPVKRNTIAMGKMIGLGILATISTFISIVAVIFSLPKLMQMSGEELSSQLMYGPMEYFQVAVILFLEVGIFVGIICLISVLSRTVKEAGTYVTPAYMVVMMGAFAAMFSFGKTADYMYAIPLIGNIFALKSALMFELNLLQLGITTVVSLLVIAALTYATAKAFNSEKIMFNA